MISALPVTAAKRHAAGQRLGDRDEIRLDAGMLDGEERPGAAEAGLDLVGDQHDAVLVGDRPQRLHELDRCGNESAFAEHGLDDDCGDAIRRDRCFEEVLERVERAASWSSRGYSYGNGA